MASVPPSDDINRDLGFGSRLSQSNTGRLLNRDGSFNAARSGLPFYRTQNFYHALLTISWTRFFLLIIGGYILANLLFATAYVLCGPDALRNGAGAAVGGSFFEAFFFSVQTLSTIGYGALAPNGLAANIVVSMEALAGLLGFALVTGILFARFSRPSASILYSRNAVIAPYRDITGFMFRIANEHSNQLIEVSATVTLTWDATDGEGNRKRNFYALPLERQKVVFFPLHWVIVHPIDATSPLYGVTPEQLTASRAEFLILLTAFDETFSQTVHSRSSYHFNEVRFGVKFADMFTRSDDGTLGIDLTRIHLTEPA